MKKLVLLTLATIAFNASANNNGGLCGSNRPMATVLNQRGMCAICSDPAKWQVYSIHINGSFEIFATKFPNEAMQRFNIMVQQGQCG